MGFMQDRAAEAKAAVAADDPEQAAEIVVHALLEGPGSLTENLDGLTDAAQADKS
jgi:hypothetical protein